MIPRVARRVKGFGVDVAEVDVLEWCMQVENELCPNVDNMYIYTRVPLKVISDTAKLPCNIYRISDIYTAHSSHDHGSRVPFTDLGSIVTFNPKLKVQHPYIDYWGSPIDLDTGDPLLQRGHENACEWYCTYNLLFNEAGTGRINANFFSRVEANKDNEILAAQCYSVHFKTRDELNQEQRITFDEMPEPARLWLLDSERKHHVYHVVP